MNRRWIRLISLAAVLIPGISILTACSSSVSPAPAGAPTSTPTAFNQNSSTVSSENGLILTLSIGSTRYQSGEEIFIHISEKNTLEKVNHVPVAGRWPVQGLNVGPCGTLNYPFGISLLQGYYDISQAASVMPVNLYDPTATYHCPVILAGITAYEFQPSSENAVIHTQDDSAPLEIQMNAGISSKGFWSGSPRAILKNFTPGTYTVVGGDEWGALTLLHFVVNPSD